MKKLFPFFIFLFPFFFLNAQSNDLTLVVKSFTHYPPIQTNSLNLFLEVYKGKTYIGKTNIVYEDDQPHFNEVFQIKDYNNEPIIIAAYVHRGPYYYDNYIGKVIIKNPEDGKYDVMSSGTYYHDYYRGIAAVKKPVDARYEVNDVATYVENNNVGSRVEGNIEVEFK